MAGAGYMLLLILLTLPCLAELIFWLWTTPIINTCARIKLPSVRHLCLGLLSSALEGVALAVIGAEVAHALPEPVLLTLPFSVVAFDLLKDTVKFVKKLSNNHGGKADHSSPCKSYLSVLTAGLLASYPLLVTPLVGTVLCLWTHFEFSFAQCAVATTSVLLLTTIWDPEVMSLTFLSPGGKARCSRVQMIYAIVKISTITATLFFSLAFKVVLFRNFPYEHLVFAFQESAQFGVFFPLVLCCFGGLFSFLLSVAASKVRLVTPVLQISMFLSPVLAILLSAVLWNDFETGAFWEVTADDFMSWFVVVLSAGVWLVPNFVSAFQRLGNAKISNRKLQDSFYSFYWSPFFLEPRILLNYEKDFIILPENGMLQSQNLRDFKQKSDCKTVFICTTMYKETEAEMSRYLRSIKNTFEHDWDQQGTRVEAHVVFDSSISSNEINLKGRHFLGLLCEMFDLNDTDLLKFSTPYGCQVEVPKLVKSHALIIHFKDATKVKAKKRWSQVMYMHYVIKVRSQRNQGNHNTPGHDGKFQSSQRECDNFAPPNVLPVVDVLYSNGAAKQWKEPNVRFDFRHVNRIEKDPCLIGVLIKLKLSQGRLATQVRLELAPIPNGVKARKTAKVHMLYGTRLIVFMPWV
ncbi:hypothetical protein EGW08_011412 [Elysia chlorotica]|uniref:Uncharacterized protein n=1 Tax=Elysia chlorotica TaxID=188477 RepID=A0A3S1C251_ELYCH|nr:hypothetical protein EGW08_011412 [Elysia chlorotica]